MALTDNAGVLVIGQPLVRSQANRLTRTVQDWPILDKAA